MKIHCVTDKGGAVELNAEHGVGVSYAVASVADYPPPEIFYAWLTLPNGKQVQLFVNRETGLVVVDVIEKNGKYGNEILRHKAS